jgi:hypothetical protein
MRRNTLFAEENCATSVGGMERGAVGNPCRFLTWKYGVDDNMLCIQRGRGESCNSGLWWGVVQGEKRKGERLAAPPFVCRLSVS